MKDKGLFLLFFIFIFMYILNAFTPLLADDYFSAFVWNEGVRLNGLLPENATRINSFSDLYVTLKGYYLTWGGRIPGRSMASFFIWQGKAYFDFVNAFMMTFLVAEIYWLSDEGRVNHSFQASYILWIFFSLWAFNAGFIDTCLWIAGSCDYLWSFVLVLAFLIPYVRNYFDVATYRNCSAVFVLGMFLLGLFAGWGHEISNCWVALLLLLWLVICKKHDNLQYWKISGFVGFCLGYALLMFAPGNYSRLLLQQNTNSVIITSNLLGTKLLQTAIILFFHLIIWYSIVSFFYKYRKYKNLFFDKDTGLYLKISVAFIIIALGSGIIMFFLPSSGIRSSFINLVYLIIASAFLFRVQKKNNISFINSAGKKFLCFVGGVYLVITMTVSLLGNYFNWCHWNDMLAYMSEARERNLNSVLEIPPPLTAKNGLWLFGSGLRLVPMPVMENETHEFNKMISIYYGLYGVKRMP